MALFEKKFCDICGEKISLLGKTINIFYFRKYF